MLRFTEVIRVIQAVGCLSVGFHNVSTFCGGLCLQIVDVYLLKGQAGEIWRVHFLLQLTKPAEGENTSAKLTSTVDLFPSFSFFFTLLVGLGLFCAVQ